MLVGTPALGGVELSRVVKKECVLRRQPDAQAKEARMHSRITTWLRIRLFFVAWPGGNRGAADDKPAGKERPANRLAKETSPYLLLHAHNPVDWYPWGPEALARAKAENKPSFCRSAIARATGATSWSARALSIRRSPRH